MDRERVEHLEQTMLEVYRAELHDKLNDPTRLEAVYGSHFIDGRHADKLNALCQAAAQLTRSPGAQVNVLTDETQVTVASYGSPLMTIEAEEAYCVHTLAHNREHLSIEDSLRSALVCYSDATVEAGLRAYLGVPLIDDRGNILGALCVYDFVPRRWTPTDIFMLSTLASTVMAVEQQV